MGAVPLEMRRTQDQKQEWSQQECWAVCRVSSTRSESCVEPATDAVNHVWDQRQERCFMCGTNKRWIMSRTKADKVDHVWDQQYTRCVMGGTSSRSGDSVWDQSHER